MTQEVWTFIIVYSFFHGLWQTIKRS